MNYLGGKHRIAKYIVPLMESYRLLEQAWVEPFMGACNTLALAQSPRYGNDLRADVVALFNKATHHGYNPPTAVSREEYYTVKRNPHEYPPELRAFVGIGCSFAGKEWRGYAANTRGYNYVMLACRGLLRKAAQLQGTVFSAGSYDQMHIPPRSLIYCDPPYAGATGYGVPFDTAAFWDWCRARAQEGHTVFVSEYTAPPDVSLVWERAVQVHLNNTDNSKGTLSKTERLYLVPPHPPLTWALTPA